MNLYEIDSRIASLLDGTVDEETGEILTDYDALDALLMERDEKREAVACHIVNLRREAEAIRTQEKILAERRKALEFRADRAMIYLRETSHGEELRSPRVTVTFRKAPPSAVFDSESRFIEWAAVNREEFLRYKAPEIDRVAVKKAIQSGEIIPGATVESKISMVVK